MVATVRLMPALSLASIGCLGATVGWTQPAAPGMMPRAAGQGASPETRRSPEKMATEKESAGGMGRGQAGPMAFSHARGAFEQHVLVRFAAGVRRARAGHHRLHRPPGRCRI